jgi:hypothetical protein
MVRVTLMTVMLFVVQVSAIAEPRAANHLNKAVLNALAQASSVRDLDRRWTQLSEASPVERIVFAARRAQLAPSKRSDLLLIEAIPSDAETFDLLYSLCYNRAEGSSSELKEIAGGSWIDLALESVLRQRRGYGQILMLAYVGRHNADIGETIPCTISELQSRAPNAYARALRSLSAEERKLVCPDCC